MTSPVHNAQWFASVNPNAGKTSLAVDDVRQAADDAGVDMVVSVSDSVGEASDAIRQAILSGRTRFVAVGGDGTASLVANALFAQPARHRYWQRSNKSVNNGTYDYLILSSSTDLACAA